MFLSPSVKTSLACLAIQTFLSAGFPKPLLFSATDLEALLSPPVCLAHPQTANWDHTKIHSPDLFLTQADPATGSGDESLALSWHDRSVEHNPGTQRMLCAETSTIGNTWAGVGLEGSQNTNRKMFEAVQHQTKEGQVESGKSGSTGRQSHCMQVPLHQYPGSDQTLSPAPDQVSFSLCHSCSKCHFNHMSYDSLKECWSTFR